MEHHKEISFEYAKKIYEVLKYVDYIKEPFLLQIKDELYKDDLVHFNTYFPSLLKSRELYIDEEICVPSIINYLNKEKIKYKLINNNKVLEEKTYLEFQNAYEELFYVFNEIASLLDKGIDINRIALYGINEEYRFYIDYLVDKFHFDVDYPSLQSAYTSFLGKEIVNLLKTKKVNEVYEELINKYQDDDITKKNIYKITSELINYESDKLDYDTQQDIYHNVIKDYSLVSFHKKDAVKILKEPIIDDSLYIFALNFSLDFYPVISTNTTIIDTKTYIDNNVFNVEEKNQISKNKIISFLSQDNIMLISRKINGSSTNNYLPSLAKEFSFKRKNKIALQETQYSVEALGNKLATIYDARDKYRKFNEYSDAIAKKINIDFKTYDNSFDQMDLLKDNAVISLSYSRFNSYMECPYSFYLKYILLKDNDKDNEDDEEISDFSIRLGDFLHKVIEIKTKKKDFDYDFDFDEIRKTFPFDEKELMLLRRIKDDFKEFLNFIDRQEKSFRLDSKILSEEVIDKFEIAPQTYVKGKLDKIYLLEDKTLNNKFLAVVDYKSSIKDFSSKKVSNGLALQLPTYLFLLNNSEKFKDYKIIGAFYQGMLPKGLNSSYIDNYYKDNYAQGIYTSDYNRLTLLDQLVLPSKLKAISKGTLPSESKGKIYYSDNDLELLYLEVRKQYIEAANNIRNNVFDIAPKQFGSENPHCSYCEYKDVCYVTYKDIVHINNKKDEESEED